MDSSDHQPNPEKLKKWMKIRDVDAVIAATPTYKKILFSDGKTKLSDYISVVKNVKDHEVFLQSLADINMSLPLDSPLWPGSTPLHLVTMFSEHLENEDKAAQLVNQCLKQGAVVNIQNKRGATPLHLAFRLEQQKIIALLLRNLESESKKVVNLLDKDNLSYLHIACSTNNHRNSLTRKLLSEAQGVKATVNLAYRGEALSSLKPGWTPLHVAVNQGDTYLAESLVQRGADPACPDAGGTTAIHLLFGAAQAKPLADAWLASEHLRECISQDTGLSHLLVAVWFGNVQSVESLLDMGADIEATIKILKDQEMKQFEGCTPLYIALIRRHEIIIRILLKRGANIFARRFDGSFPLSTLLTASENKRLKKDFLALIWSDVKIQKHLEELGITMLHMACYSDVRTAIALIDKGANVNAKISDNSNFWKGCTPLHVSALDNCYEGSYEGRMIIEKLLKTDCDIDTQDDTGKTALHYLTSNFRHHDMVTLLLLAGADINITDRSCKSAFSYIMDRSEASEYFSSYRYYRDTAKSLLIRFALLVHKMKLTGIEVSRLNENLRDIVFKNFNVSAYFKDEAESTFCDQLEQTVKVILGKRGLTLRSFLFETAAISRYPSLTPEDRSEVIVCFQSLKDHGSDDDWKFLCNLQYRKVRARLSLVDSAAGALKDMIDPSFPDLCVDIVLKYLSNSQIKVLIAASQIIN